MTTYSRLTREQRYTIESMSRNGSLQKEIATAIGVDPSTVSRELRRGGMARGSYCFVAAQRHAESREWKGRRVAPEVLALAERARAAVAALELVDMEGADLAVSTSVGVAELGPGVTTVTALIAEADSALYEAKHAGKNCVRFGPATDHPAAIRA